MTRDDALVAYAAAVAACDPARAVAAALLRVPLVGKRVFAVAIGKCAAAMARGAGRVHDGLVISPDRVELAGWDTMVAAHPQPDDSSLDAGEAAMQLVTRAGPGDVVLALISGGASSLVEHPRVPFDRFRAIIATAMAAGLPIADLNELRTSMSWIKSGGLARMASCPVVTLVVSDVIGDSLATIGSGLTIARDRAQDRSEVIMPMSAFADAALAALAGQGIRARRLDPAMTGDVAAVADRLVAHGEPCVAWGEPTIVVPDDHGIGGRAQQLALDLAKRLRGSARAALVVGSDGIDGPTNAAGAYIDGTTWDRIADGDRALTRRDAGSALASVDALVVPGATGINFGDIAIVI